ncbi:hypothetical protein C8J56DRAFT_154730 [Mycena floridula]|nr:hypothetical protein C8J56DRAFT_154730 [Mycena floridula]
MWTTTSSVSLKRQVLTTKDAALALFHDPVAMCNLNPLVASLEQDSADPNLYTVTDNLTVLGFYKTTTTFTVRFSPQPDGTDTVVNASGGTIFRGKWRLRTDEQEVSWICDDVEIQSLFFLKSYIVSTLTKAHGKVLDKMLGILQSDDVAS